MGREWESQGGNRGAGHGSPSGHWLETSDAEVEDLAVFAHEGALTGEVALIHDLEFAEGVRVEERLQLLDLGVEFCPFFDHALLMGLEVRGVLAHGFPFRDG